MVNRFLTVVMLLLVWALPAHAFTPASFIKTQCVSSKIVKISWMACSEKKASRIPSVPRSWIERSTCQPVSTTTANCTADSYCTSDPAIVSTPQCVKPDLVYPDTTCGGPTSVTHRVMMKGKTTYISEACPPATPQCVNGQCVAADNAGCLDSDKTKINLPAGKYDMSIITAGKVTISGKDYPDTCKAPLYLNEMACSPTGQLQMLGVDCGKLGGKCVNGACTGMVDGDQDGVPDVIDNCPKVANPDQGDINTNGVGDACDSAVPCADDQLKPAIIQTDKNFPPADCSQTLTFMDGQKMQWVSNRPDFYKDDDGDGIMNVIEKCVTGTDPNKSDTDGDGVSDGYELKWQLNEVGVFDGKYHPEHGETDPLNPNTDGDANGNDNTDPCPLSKNPLCKEDQCIASAPLKWNCSSEVVFKSPIKDGETELPDQRVVWPHKSNNVYVVDEDGYYTVSYITGSSR